MNTGKWGGLRWAAAPALLCMTLLVGTGARAQTVFVSTSLLASGVTTNRFGTLDLATGAFQQIGGNLDRQIYGLAYSQANSSIFAIDAGNQLFQINPNTGAIASQFAYSGLDAGQFLQSIAFDYQTNTLYGLASDFTQANQTGSNATLYRLSTTNSAGNTATKIGSALGFNTFGGFAIVTTNGVSTGYATQGVATNAGTTGNGPVFQINLNGTASRLGNQTNAGFTGPISGLASVNGLLRAADYNPNLTGSINNTYSVNLTSGLATPPTGTYNSAVAGNVFAMTSSTPNIAPAAAPEPGTLALLASGLSVGLGGTAFVRRRKKA